MELRKFDSGAIRDQNNDKPNYAGFTSPLVLKAFGEYMLKHQILPDGSKRQADNWKGLFGEDHMKVCYESKCRHDLDLAMIMDGYENWSRDVLIEVLCAIKFNVDAMIYKIMKERYEGEKK
ncbi:MAG: hypothetical protein WC516_06180 [Patescibacteria group bacterium]|jgi:hypothetical protein